MIGKSRIAPADRASTETLVQHNLDAQGKNVAPYEAEIDAIAVLGHLGLLSNIASEPDEGK